MNLVAIRITDGGTVLRKANGRTPAFFSQAQPAIVNVHTITELVAHAKEIGGDVRLCLHKDPEARHHDMIIAQLRGSYFPPHRHAGKGETWNILRGEMAVFVFNDAGGIIDARKLSPEEDFLYRVGDSQYHMVMPLSPVAVYHESKPGPFLGAMDSCFAPWAPDKNEKKATGDYINSLLSLLQG